VRVLELGVVEFLNLTVRAGGIGGEFSPRNRAAIGQAVHQDVLACRPAGYQREAPVRLEFEWQQYRLVVRGRIDGLLVDAEGVTVEEIKSTYRALDALRADDNPLHLAQLQLYHHFCCLQHPGARVTPVLTYVQPQTLAERAFVLPWSAEDSRQAFAALAMVLLRREEERREWQQVRNKSLSKLRFPFDTLRPGQPALITAVERAIENRHDLLAEAATGIGKSVGVLYPALRKLTGRHGYNRLFYLTAKSAGGEAARHALALFRAQGARLRVLYLSAKSRCCPLPGAMERPDCDDLVCPYAEDYYVRSEPVVARLLATAEEFTPELIAEVAEQEQLCPFELALDLSLHADVIVCDYNYVFDPSVWLRRFFFPGLPDDHLFLIDEAHNLLPRGREMYSGVLEEALLQELAAYAVPGLPDALHPLQWQFRAWREALEMEGSQAMQLPELPADLENWLTAVQDRLLETLALLPRGETRTNLRELFFTFSRFARIAAELTPEHVPYISAHGHTLRLRLSCVHPGPLLRRRLERSTAAIFFSGTLSPRDYFSELLGVREGGGYLALPSPFPRENRLYLHVPNVSTKYQARDATRPAVSRVILETARARRGNYLAFFPSYAYLSAVWAEIMVTRPEDIAIHVQRPGMSLEQQAEFLRKACTAGDGKTNLGLAVMGGLFGEAIDLPGEQLVGTLIIGPGLPALSLEQELIGNFFNEQREDEGFLYAFIVPGMIRVIQAAGRVFRTPTDRGVVVLMDDRFLESPYRDLLPADWEADEEEFSNLDYRGVLEEFWSEP